MYAHDSSGPGGCRSCNAVTLLGANSLSMVVDVERHRYLRRLISPGMASEEIDAALPRLALLADKLLEGWAVEGDAGRTVSAVQGPCLQLATVIAKHCFL